MLHRFEFWLKFNVFLWSKYNDTNLINSKQKHVLTFCILCECYCLYCLYCLYILNLFSQVKGFQSTIIPTNPSQISFIEALLDKQRSILPVSFITDLTTFSPQVRVHDNTTTYKILTLLKYVDFHVKVMISKTQWLSIQKHKSKSVLVSPSKTNEICQEFVGIVVDQKPLTLKNDPHF